MPTQQNIWDADWQPYDDDEDPFAGDWEATEQPGPANPWEGDWQPEVEEAPTVGGRIKESWEIGKKQVAIGRQSLSQILGDKTPETEARIQAIEETIPKGPRPERALPEQAVRAAAEMAPIPLTGMEQGLKRGAALGLGFGAIATLGGPAAPITVPAAAMAGFSIGMISASLENIGGIEAGLAYREFKELKDPETGEPMDETVAKVAGIGVGVINGAIELMQIKTFLRSIPGAEALVRKAVTGSIKKALTSKALKAIAFRAAKKYATGVATETGQEELQEIVNISGKYLSTEVNNALKGTNIPTQTKKEILEQLWETGKQSALAFSVFMAPGSAVSTTQEVIDRRAAGPPEADLLKTDAKAAQLETKLRDDYNTGKITSSDLKEIQSQIPKKHPTYKVIEKILKESAATTPEKDMMTGEILNLKPEDFIPGQAIPEMTTPEALAPEQEDGFSKFIDFQPREEFPSPQEAIPGGFPPLAGVSARESAQVFEQDRAARIAAQVETQRIEDEQAAERATRDERIRQSLAGKEALAGQVKRRETRAEIEGMEFRVPYINGILEQVKGAEAGKRIRVQDYDGTEKWFGVKSEFPDFMKNKYGKKEVVKAIEKGLAGYQFPENEVRQAGIWEDVKAEAYNMRNRDLRLAGEMYIEEPTTIEGLPDREYKLLITELQHEGYSTREIEEIAARHRTKIAGDVIASIGNQYGFSKEEIQAILDDPMEPVSDLDGAWKEATGTKPVEAYLTPIKEGEEYDLEKKRRVARPERKREEPGRPVSEREAGKREAEPSGVLQTPEQIEQKAKLIAKLINEKLLPGHDLEYDGTWPGVDNLWQFTPYAKDSPAYKATFAVTELEADKVYEGLQRKIKDFTEHPPEDFKAAIDLAAKEVETAPTEAQIEAGNYKKGHISLYGLDITIENPRGSVRKGIGADGKPWRTVMKQHYGYIRRTEDKDGDQVDVFVGDNITSDNVFVVNQIDPGTKKFDEHKAMIGFDTVEKARVAYLANYERGWKGLGNIIPLSVDDFKAWLKEGDLKKPVSKAIEPTVEYGHILEKPGAKEVYDEWLREFEKVEYPKRIKEAEESRAEVEARLGPLADRKIEFIHHIKHTYDLTLEKAKEIADGLYSGKLNVDDVRAIFAKPVGKEIKALVEKAPAPKALKQILENPSITQEQATREKAHLKAKVIEGVKSGKYKGAVRFSTVVDLKKTIEGDKLYVSREGAIHATPILGPDDDIFPAYGSYKNHPVAYIIPEKYVQSKPDAHTKEVLIDRETPLDAVTFLVDGQDKEFNIIELISTLNKRPDAADLIKQYREQYGDTEAFEFYKEITGGTGRFKWQGAVVHGSTLHPGGWRITYFDAEGFSGHSEFDTLEKAVGEGIDSGFETPKPGLLDKSAEEKGFIEGTLRTYKAQKEHAARMAAPEKELWQMTKAEQLEKIGRPVREHRDAILKAHEENKTIPTEVLDDFPEISKRLGFVKKEKPSPVNALIAEIRADIMPNNNLKRGLDHYATQYKDFTTDQLKELLAFTKTQNPYVRKRLGGNIQSEIMFREEKAGAKEPWEMTGRQFFDFETGGGWLIQTKAARELTLKRHRKLVEQAKAEGKDIPDNVLAEYPHLVEEKAGAGKPWALTQDEYLKGDARTQRREAAYTAVALAAEPIRGALNTIGFWKEGETLEVALNRKARQQSVFFTDKVRRGTKERGTGLQEMSAKGWTDVFKEKAPAERFRKAVLVYIRGLNATWLEKGETFDSPNILTPVKHEALVKEALNKGERVPDKVLRGYPELELEYLVKELTAKGKEHAESDVLTEGLGGEKYTYKTRELIKSINFLLEERPDLVKKIPPELNKYFERKAEPLVLTPEQGTEWERQAELEREGVVERPAKGKKVKAKFGEKGITGAGIAGRQQGLFGYAEGETADMFAEAEAKAKLEKKDPLEQIRADAKKGKKAGIEYVAQMEVAETGDIVEVTMDAGTALNEADNRLEACNKLLECIESD